MAESQPGALAGTGAQGLSSLAIEGSGPCIHTPVLYTLLCCFSFACETPLTLQPCKLQQSSAHIIIQLHPTMTVIQKSKTSKLQQPLPDFPSPFLG